MVDLEKSGFLVNPVINTMDKKIKAMTPFEKYVIKRKMPSYQGKKKIKDKTIEQRQQKDLEKKKIQTVRETLREKPC